MPEHFADVARRFPGIHLLALVNYGPCLADPQLSDDLNVCRDRQADLKTRVVSCERLIAGGTLTGKDLAIALNVRGSNFMARRDIDKATPAAIIPLPPT